MRKLAQSVHHSSKFTALLKSAMKVDNKYLFKLKIDVVDFNAFESYLNI